MRYHLTLQLDCHRTTATVKRAPCRDTYPAFADAIFFNIHAFGAVEVHADRLRQKCFVIVWAARVNAEAVRESVGHWVRDDGGGSAQPIASCQRGHPFRGRLPFLEREMSADPFSN